MTITPEMEKEVAAIRAQVHKILLEAQAFATKHHKPLLIMVGEAHSQAQCPLLETVIYQEARKLGIKDVAFEFSQEMMTAAKAIPLTRTTATGHMMLSKQAECFGAQIHTVDDLHDSGTDENGENVDTRNKPIAQNLANIPRPVLMLTGAAHLKGLMANLALQKSHEIVCFDTSPTLPTEHKYRYNNTVHRLHLHSEAAALTLDQVITCGLGAKDGQFFTEWAEKNGGKPSMRESAMGGSILAIITRPSKRPF